MKSANQSDDSYRAVVPEGTHLAWSKENTDAKRALLFDNETNKLVGPPELLKVEDDYVFFVNEPEHESAPLTDEEREAIVLALTLVSLVLFEVIRFAVVAINTKARPRLEAWWIATAFPKIKEILRLKGDRIVPPADTPHKHVFVPELVDVSSIEPSVFAHEMEVGLERYRSGMTPVEAYERRLSISLAEAFIAEQKRKLSDARMEDYDYFLELNNTIGQLASQQVPDSITLILDANPAISGRIALRELSTNYASRVEVEQSRATSRDLLTFEEFRLTEFGTPYFPKPHRT